MSFKLTDVRLAGLDTGREVPGSPPTLFPDHARNLIHPPRPPLRTTIITAFVGLTLPAFAHAAIPCGQADPRTTRAIFEQGEYAKGCQLHAHALQGRPTDNYRTRRSHLHRHLPFVYLGNTPAGELTVQLLIVYVACVPSGPPPYKIQPPDTPGTCPYIYLRGYPEV